MQLCQHGLEFVHCCLSMGSVNVSAVRDRRPGDWNVCVFVFVGHTVQKLCLLILLVSLAGVMGQCASLTRLFLSCNSIGPEGAESLAGVLAQCPALDYLALQDNNIGAVGEGRLRASWRGQASGLPL